MRLVLLGPPGAGKGTQAVHIARAFEVPRIATGDIFRENVRNETALGKEARSYMERGDLVPDDVVIGMVTDRLTQDDATKGFLLDGFPRTVPQAEALAELTQPKGIDLAVDLEVPTEIVLKRLASRRVCVDCGTNYSTDVPPKEGWTCDSCGGEVIQRRDDTEDAIRRRLEIYEHETAPLVAWFMERDMLVIVDGTGHPDTVTGRLVRAIDARRHV